MRPKALLRYERRPSGEVMVKYGLKGAVPKDEHERDALLSAIIAREGNSEVGRTCLLCEMRQNLILHKSGLGRCTIGGRRQGPEQASGNSTKRALPKRT